MTAPPMTHTWLWDKWPRTALSLDHPDAFNPKRNPASRKGQRCRVVVKSKGPGPRNGLVEFECGVRIVVTNAALRYAMKPLCPEQAGVEEEKEESQLSLWGSR